ncbi:hypothetical protein O0L34_g2542 [Tuta absoluta]|nr:hypothetical protein O0L34_g2542 [Tuta absoluta]
MRGSSCVVGRGCGSRESSRCTASCSAAGTHTHTHMLHSLEVLDEGQQLCGGARVRVAREQPLHRLLQRGWHTHTHTRYTHLKYLMRGSSCVVGRGCGSRESSRCTASCSAAGTHTHTHTHTLHSLEVLDEGQQLCGGARVRVAREQPLHRLLQRGWHTHTHTHTHATLT